MLEDVNVRVAIQDITLTLDLLHQLFYQNMNGNGDHALGLLYKVFET
jgi:hypothetical protein